MKQGTKAGSEKLPVDDHDGDGKQHLKHAEKDMVFKCFRCRPAPHHMAHGEVHQHEENDPGEEQTFFQLRSLFVFQSFIVRPGRCSPDSTGGPGSIFR